MPQDKIMEALLGGGVHEGSVNFTKGQFNRLMECYGYDPALTKAQVQEHVDTTISANEKSTADNAKLTTYETHKRQPLRVPDPDGVKKFLEAGARQGIMRAVNHDGMRVMGLLSKFLEDGEDPVHLVARLMIDAGYDVEMPEDMDAEDNSEC